MLSKIKVAILVFIIILIGALGVFIIPKNINKTSSKLRVVTTFAPMYIFTKNIVGDLAEVENFLPAGVGPHDYSLTPSDMVKLSKAEVIVKNGRGVEAWLDDAISSNQNPNLKVIDASAGIKPHTGLTSFNIDSMPIEVTTDTSLVRPQSEDPHIWLDPFLAVKQVENIRNELMKIDPKNKDEYARNAEIYILKLLALDGQIRNMFDTLSKREFITFHPAFRYYAYEYGLREIGVIEEIPGQEPTPAELTRLVDDAKKANVKVIFSEPQFSPKIVETLANDYDLQIAELDPLETGRLEPDYYINKMLENTQNIINAFTN